MITHWCGAHSEDHLPKEGLSSRRETDAKKESEEEKSVGERKEKTKTRREAWEREAREAKKAGKNEMAQKKNPFYS